MPRYKCVGCGEIHNDNDYSEKDGDILIEEGCKTECMKGGLWLTAMGRIVLDDHNHETYATPYDRKIMTAEELTHGIKFHEFQLRFLDALQKDGE